MLAEELDLSELTTLKPSDSVDLAITLMDEHKVMHLPVVYENRLKGIISEDQLMNNLDATQVRDLLIQETPISVSQLDHLFEVIRVMNEYDLTTMPVLNAKNQAFMGCISVHQLMKVISEMTVVQSKGGIIVIEMQIRDLSLSQIARIVENNNAIILGSIITRNPDASVIELTLKINKANIQPIVQSFERFNYKVVSSYDQSDQNDMMQDRYDALMIYLNI